MPVSVYIGNKTRLSNMRSSLKEPEILRLIAEINSFPEEDWYVDTLRPRSWMHFRKEAIYSVYARISGEEFQQICFCPDDPETDFRSEIYLHGTRAAVISYLTGYLAGLQRSKKGSGSDADERNRSES